MGIAVAGTNSTAKEVLRSADTAMYAAKQQGKGRRALFDPSDVPRNYPDSVDSYRLGLRTFVSVPVLLSSQTVWGTLCGASRADVAVDENTVTVMERFAELISHRLESTLGPPTARDIDGRRARIPANGVHRALPSA